MVIDGSVTMDTREELVSALPLILRIERGSAWNRERALIDLCGAYPSYATSKLTMLCRLWKHHAA